MDFSNRVSVMRFEKTAGLAAAVLLASSIGAHAAITYATAVDWTNNGTVKDAARTDKTNALNAPDQDGKLPVKWLSLGIGGSAIFGFGGQVLGAGTIFEVTYDCVISSAGTCTYAETADIYGVRAVDYTLGGSVDPRDFVPDAADKIISVPNGSAQGGFNSRSERPSTTSSCATPLPRVAIVTASTSTPSEQRSYRFRHRFLLLGGLAGLGFVSRKRKAA